MNGDQYYIKNVFLMIGFVILDSAASRGKTAYKKENGPTPYTSSAMGVARNNINRWQPPRRYIFPYSWLLLVYHFGIWTIMGHARFFQSCSYLFLRLRLCSSCLMYSLNWEISVLCRRKGLTRT